MRTPEDGNLRDLSIYVKNKMQYPINAVEVGVEMGFNASEMLNKMNISRLFLVDPYAEYSDCLASLVTQSSLDDAYSFMLTNVAPWSDKVDIRKMSSQEAAVAFGDGTLDFVYIDANHNYGPFKADLAAWYPKVKVGGVIGGHDYVSSSGIHRAVNEFAVENGLTVKEFLDDARQTEWAFEK